MHDELAELIKIDPLAVAEKISGQRVEDGVNGFAFGLAMVQAKTTRMRELLSERNDVWDGMPLNEYQSVVENYGFELILEIPFKSDDRNETLFFYAHHDGLLLKFDTYMSDRVNSGNVYYCCDLGGKQKDAWITSGGGFIAPEYRIWHGWHDCREALIFNLERLRSHGKFLTPWPKRPHLWLLHYQDTKIENYDYKMINADRIALMPRWVQEMIGPEDA